ncbi:protein Skeletor, isoforms D/E-like [Scaptodrosophila lebanonensis]|uniref:Protein Skeletor, isoforms D/E-like n=1 Tax=Drosophila lebanonensis TaxID=7225 RepID=A0A6J2T0E3_DROLE|nr:protein Skeletor, isoforms D/E-like [Scaptodrosophila lebanonensis]
MHQRLHHHYTLPHAHPHHIHPHHHSHVPNNLTSNLAALAQKTISLSEYLRPPQNAPLFHPVKLPGRRPYPGPIKKVPASRPVLPQQLPRHPPPVGPLLSQPSVIINHYRKPVPSLLKPFLKEQPFPLQPIAASVLLLGQPTELSGKAGQRKTDPHHLKPQPVIPLPVPYDDLETQSTLQNSAYFNSHVKPEKKPLPTLSSTTTTSSPFKRPYSTHEPQEEPSLQEIASMRPAVNQGFKPDSVVVESGFRPIIRNDGNGVQLPPEIVEQVAHRREDPGTEIDEAMETDTLFLTAQQGNEPQSFEPMFIPSPLDSTNATILLKNSAPTTTTASSLASASALRLPSAALEHALPSASKLRKPTLEELFGEELLETGPDATAEEEQLVGTINPASKQTEHTTTEKLSKTDTDYSDLASLFEGEDDEQLPADDMEEEEDKEAQAAERIDTYYLPPDNRKIPHAGLPSGALYTFDGKSVVDSTLVLPPKLEARDTGLLRRPHYGLTPLEELIRTTPQFGAYRGELPEEFQTTENTVLPPVQQPVTEYSNPVPYSRSTATARSSSGSSTYGSTSSLFTSRISSNSIHSHTSPLPLSSLRPISTKLHLLNADSNNST